MQRITRTALRRTLAPLAAVLLWGASVPVATAVTADDVVCDGCVDGDDIAARAVGRAELAPEAVGTAKIAPRAVATSRLADDAVTTDKLAGQAVTLEKLAPGSVGRNKLRARAVATGKLADGAVTRAKLAPEAWYPPIGGDGSGGDVVISSNTDWSTAPPSSYSFNSLTIDPGVLLTVDAGVTLRCAEGLTNLGTIRVDQGARNAHTVVNGAASSYAISDAHPGDTAASALRGDYHNDAVNSPEQLVGGTGGALIGQGVAMSAFDRFAIGGGAGAGPGPSEAGGLLRVYASGDIVSPGTIEAAGGDGSFGAGGAGGGIVILASETAIDLTGGMISVPGGNGGDADVRSLATNGAGGGGGGGIVVLVAPSVSREAAALELGGGQAGGGAGVTTTTASRIAGGGGGGSGGQGGQGGPIAQSGALLNGAAGDEGYVVEMLANPAAVIR